jgi:hypothetical protein
MPWPCLSTLDSNRFKHLEWKNRKA